MIKIKLENLKVTSFVTSIDNNKTQTVKGGNRNPSNAVPNCDPYESVNCAGSINISDYAQTACGCANTRSIIKVCEGTNNPFNCPRSGEPENGTQIGISKAC